MLPFDRTDQQRYPISVAWQPPFTMLVDLIGRGDVQVLSVFLWPSTVSQQLEAHKMGPASVHSKGNVHAGNALPSQYRSP